MYVSDKLNAAFIHIPKTGGTAVRKLIFEPNEMYEIGGMHAKISECEIDDRFIFTFVRNPYHRFASWFHAYKGDPRRKFSHLSDMLDWLMLKGPIAQIKWIDDRVKWYRFEEYTAGINDICARLSIDFPDMNPTPETNYKGKYDWREIISNERDIKIINRHCREDFIRFGYEQW